MKVTVQESRSGSPTLICEVDGKLHPVYSLYDPERDGIRFYREYSSGAGELCIFVGIGLGYHIKYFAASKAVKKIIILEPHPELWAAVKGCANVRDILGNEKVEFYLGKDIHSFIQGIRNHYDYLFYNGIQVLSYRRLKSLFRADYLPMEERIEEELQGLVNDGLTIGKFARLWMNNFFSNVKNGESLPLVSSLYNQWDGEAVITGAGPSLDRAEGHIKRNRKKIFIIATDASVKPLVRWGIRPDLIVSVDPQPVVQYHFLGLTEKWIKDIPVVLNLLSCHAIFKVFPRKYLYFTMHPTTALFTEILSRKGENIFNYRAVSSFAFKLAVLMGFKTVHLAGFDFSYPRLRLYAENSFFYDYCLSKTIRLRTFFDVELQMLRKLLPQKRISETDGIHCRASSKSDETGGCISSLNLRSYRRELELLIGQSKRENHTNVYNWSTLGAEIEGAKPVISPPFSGEPCRRGGVKNYMISLKFDPGSKYISHDLLMTLALRNRIYKKFIGIHDCLRDAEKYLQEKCKLRGRDFKV